jgi:hypothetical protein
MNQNLDADDLREEYDFSEGVRGKYADAYREGTRSKLNVGAQKISFRLASVASPREHGGSTLVLGRFALAD